MSAARKAAGAGFVGISDHAGWAITVTATAAGAFLDRRRIALLEPGLPTMPYHHDAQKLPLAEATRLVEAVRLSAEKSAAASLAVLAEAIALPIHGIALRTCPPLPESIAERIGNYRAMCVADWVVYRQSLAKAAQARGWRVHWYDTKHVLAQAAHALGRDSIEDLLKTTGAAVGAPWQKDHRLAMAAAIAAAAE